MSSPFNALFVGGTPTSLNKDQLVFQSGDKVLSMYLVLDGHIDLVRHTLSGSRLVLFRAGPAHVLAEASAYSESYHCDGVAISAARLISIPVAEFQRRLDQDTDLARFWAERMAHNLQAARMGSEIRTLRTVSERLDAWQTVHGDIPEKGQLQNLAQSIGVTREALYRELSKRRS